jgi:hypothetical protein
VQTLWEGEVPSEPPLRQQSQNRIHWEWLTTSGGRVQKKGSFYFSEKGDREKTSIQKRGHSTFSQKGTEQKPE